MSQNPMLYPADIAGVKSKVMVLFKPKGVPTYTSMVVILHLPEAIGSIFDQ
jgi:hypothetical protein